MPARTRGWPVTAVATALGASSAYAAVRWLARRAADQQRSAPRPGAPRVVILGAGFGGLTTAIELGHVARTDFDVTVVDRRNFHLFTPMLYQVATGLLEPGHVAYPVRHLAGAYGFSFRDATVASIDLDRREVILDDGRLPYDRLVLALGSVTNYFGNDALREHALPLKSTADAIAVRNRVVGAFERADAVPDRDRRRALLTFVVVGGGATGIELMGSLHTLIHNGLLPDYPSIDASDVRLVLAEAGPVLLNGMDPWIGETARRRLEEKGVLVQLSNPATSVTDQGIGFKDGSFVPSRTVVWAAGVRPSPIAAAVPVEKGRDGRLMVDGTLRLPSHPEVSVLGDCAWFPVPENDNRPAPPNAQTAVREARVVARNLVASLRNEPLTDFRYANEGNLVALGQGDGVAKIGPVRLEGLPAWLTWRGFYLSQLMGFKNRLGVLVEWTAAYFGARSTTCLEVSPAAAPTASSYGPSPTSESSSSASGSPMTPSARRSS